VEVNTFKKINRLYHKIIQNIAFIPIIFSLLFITVAFVLIELHETDIGEAFINLFPWLFMRDADHAADIITTLLSGMISLTVFSFSVVIIVLNQAAQNFIPKILNKLTEDKFMQTVLGFYIGTIIYYIILLSNFGKEDDQLYVPDMAFLVGIMLAIVNIFLFVFFIHRTTISIHISKLTKRLFLDTEIKLKKEGEQYKKTTETEWVSHENIWITYPSGEHGYLQSVEDELAEYLAKEDLVIKIEPLFGEYIIQKMPLISVNQSVTDDVLKKIESGLIFYNEERIGENSKYGFSQIREIAIKALSTGLNDPGTAITCLNFLTDLFCKGIKHSHIIYKKDKKGVIRIMAKEQPFEKTFLSNLSPIRNYGKNDPQILETLILSIVKVSLHDEENKYCKLLNEELQAVIETARLNIKIKADYDHFTKTVESSCNNGHYFKMTMENNWK
jgi:uncharacterized membrane protein